MAKLQLILTFFWWDKVAAWDKTSEFRRFCPGWNKRLSQLKKGDKIVLRRGYTSRTLTRRVECVRIVRGWEMPPDVQDFFGKPDESKFFEIVFQREERETTL